MKTPVCVFLLAVLAAVPASAQPKPQPAAQPKSQQGGGTPNAMQGFSKNKGQPVNIEAERLEVRDKDKMATFIGKVQVIQGDTTMRCKKLVVFYDDNEASAQEGAAPSKAAARAARKEKAQANAQAGAAGNEQKIKKLEAHGDVVVTQNDQVATGDAAVFEMASNTVTMTGNVVLTQGPNVVRGSRLVVDMTTGFSRVESGSGKNGRVQGLFIPSNDQKSGGPAKPGASTKQKPAQ